MKPEQQRIAIAEACGWTCCGCVEGCTPHGLSPSFSVHDYSFKEVMAMEVPIGDLPDYLNDLNAMHEAVKSLPQNLKPRYFACLCAVVSGAISLNGYSEATEATAAQRAEAFLKTNNK